MDVVVPQGSESIAISSAESVPGASEPNEVGEMVAAGARGIVKAKKSAKSRKDAQKKTKNSSYTRRTINVSGSVIRQTDSCIAEKPLALLANIAADTSDPDPTSQSPMNDSRHTFLEMCQYRHYQFDTLRRAKHSSMMVLYYLQHPYAKCIRPLCSECGNAIVDVRWHCSDGCANHDICQTCYDDPNITHCSDHKLIPFRVTFT